MEHTRAPSEIELQGHFEDRLALAKADCEERLGLMKSRCEERLALMESRCEERLTLLKSDYEARDYKERLTKAGYYN